MPIEGRPIARMRLLRLIAAISLACALIAIAAILNGGPSFKSQLLIAAAIFLGGAALIGMAVAVLPYLHQRKETNDSRS